jgi:hypothetical protein
LLPCARGSSGPRVSATIIHKDHHHMEIRTIQELQ